MLNELLLANSERLEEQNLKYWLVILIISISEDSHWYMKSRGRCIPRVVYYKSVLTVWTPVLGLGPLKNINNINSLNTPSNLTSLG